MALQDPLRHTADHIPLDDVLVVGARRDASVGRRRHRADVVRVAHQCAAAHVRRRRVWFGRRLPQPQRGVAGAGDERAVAQGGDRPDVLLVAGKRRAEIVGLHVHRSEGVESEESSERAFGRGSEKKLGARRARGHNQHLKLTRLELVQEGGGAPPGRRPQVRRALVVTSVQQTRRSPVMLHRPGARGQGTPC